MQTQTKNTKHAIIKDHRQARMRNVINPSYTIHAFKDHNYCDFRPADDTLLQDFEMVKETDHIVIRGNRVTFDYNYEKYPYPKEIRIVHETTTKGDTKKTVTREVAFELLKTYTGNRALNVKLEDVKLGHFGLWNRLRNRKTYYVKATKELVSAFYGQELESLTEENGRIHKKTGWHRSPMTQPFEMTLTHYKLYEQ